MGPYAVRASGETQAVDLQCLEFSLCTQRGMCSPDLARRDAQYSR